MDDMMDFFSTMFRTHNVVAARPYLGGGVRLNLRHFLLVGLLFFPSRSVAALSLYPIIASFLIFSVQRRIALSTIYFFFFLVLTSIAFIVLRDTVGLSFMNARDLTEIIRLVALVFIFGLVTGTADDRRFVYRLFGALLVVDLLLSFSQLGLLPGLLSSIAAKLYQSEFHIENSLGIARRALGLFPDPTTHGLSIALLGLFFLDDALKRRGFLPFVPLLLSLFLVALSQSQTAFLSFVAGVFVYVLVDLFSKPRPRASRVYVLLLGISVGLLIRFQAQLAYLFTLFRYGLERNSFQLRLTKSANALDAMHSDPIGLLLGWGKDFLGETSGALDNEYLFVYLIYGLPGLVVFLVLIFGVAVTAIRQKDPLAVAVTVVGFLAAFPSSFFTNLKIFIIYCLVITMSTAFHAFPRFVVRGQRKDICG